MTVGQEARSSSRLVRFGVFEADLRSGELRKNGAKIRLPGQPFEVLAMMLERPGESLPGRSCRRDSGRMGPLSILITALTTQSTKSGKH